MKKIIKFKNMESSKPLEEHALLKLNKITEILNKEKYLTPFVQELWLKANKLHPHHSVELNIRTPKFDLKAHDEGTDMYIVLDNTIDKMIKLIIKEKEKLQDKTQKKETAKKEVVSDAKSDSE